MNSLASPLFLLFWVLDDAIVNPWLADCSLSNLPRLGERKDKLSILIITCGYLTLSPSPNMKIVIIALLIILIPFVVGSYYIGDLANIVKRRRARQLRDKIKAGKASKFEKEAFEKYYYWFL